MLTAHSYSAAYVLSQQRPEPEVKPEPVIVTPQQARDMDETAGINDKEHEKCDANNASGS